jgi:hypothetical protein
VGSGEWEGRGFKRCRNGDRPSALWAAAQLRLESRGWRALLVSQAARTAAPANPPGPGRGGLGEGESGEAKARSRSECEARASMRPEAKAS